jgi:hypothetical protein
MQKIHTDFVARLTADGWIPDGNRGVHWWQIRFRKG